MILKNLAYCPICGKPVGLELYGNPKIYHWGCLLEAFKQEREQ